MRRSKETILARRQRRLAECLYVSSKHDNATGSDFLCEVRARGWFARALKSLNCVEPKNYLCLLQVDVAFDPCPRAQVEKQFFVLFREIIKKKLQYRERNGSRYA